MGELKPGVVGVETPEGWAPSEESEADDSMRGAGVFAPDERADGASRKLYLTTVASRASECDELFE